MHLPPTVNVSAFFTWLSSNMTHIGLCTPAPGNSSVSTALDVQYALPLTNLGGCAPD